MTPEEQQGIGQVMGIGGIAGGAYLANKNIDKVTGRERIYHGTGKESAKNILQEGLQGSRAGEGVSSRRINLEGLVGEGIKDKVYVAKDKNFAQSFAIQAGLENQGIEGGNPAELGASSRSASDKIRIFRNAQKDGKVLKGNIPYEELQNGTIKTTANPELLGLDKSDFVAKKMSEMNPLDKLMHPNLDKVIGRSYDALGKDTHVIEGGLGSKYFKGGEGYSRLNVKDVGRYAKKFPGRFGKGVALTTSGAGLAGGGAYALGSNLNNEKTAFTDTTELMEKGKRRMQDLSGVVEKFQPTHPSKYKQLSDIALLEYDKHMARLNKTAGSDMRDWEVNTDEYKPNTSTVSDLSDIGSVERFTRKRKDYTMNLNRMEDEEMSHQKVAMLEQRMQLEKQASEFNGGVAKAKKKYEEAATEAGKVSRENAFKNILPEIGGGIAGGMAGIAVGNKIKKPILSQVVGTVGGMELVGRNTKKGKGKREANAAAREKMKDASREYKEAKKANK